MYRHGTYVVREHSHGILFTSSSPQTPIAITNSWPRRSQANPELPSMIRNDIYYSRLLTHNTCPAYDITLTYPMCARAHISISPSRARVEPEPRTYPMSVRVESSHRHAAFESPGIPTSSMPRYIVQTFIYLRHPHPRTFLLSLNLYNYLSTCVPNTTWPLIRRILT
jgi:hypothetical protein